MKIPIIYAPQLASGLIRHRLKENKHLLKNIPIIKDYDDSSVIQTEYFKISFFPVNHNIPDAFGVVVKTPHGIVINTGDYKFD